MPNIPFLEHVLDFIQAMGPLKGMFVLFFLGAHYWIYRLYSSNIKDKQNQIDRIAADNKEYRDRFLSMLDMKFGYAPNEKGPPSSAEGESG